VIRSPFLLGIFLVSLVSCFYPIEGGPFFRIEI